MPSATHAAPLEYDFVVVSNRLPVDRVVDADGIDAWAPSPGGLVTALEPVMRDADGAWVGWAGQPDLELDPFESGGIHLVPIALSADEIENYYEGFSNDTIWPLYHDVIESPGYHRVWWESYVAVNQRFADATAAVSAQGATVWVQDYQLQLVPRMLRTARPDLTIGFFNHIPFPPLEIFAQLPWRSEVVEGLMGADLLGFQRVSDAANFHRVAKRYGGHAFRSGQTEVGAAEPDQQARTVRAEAFPISIDTTTLRELAQDPDVQERSRQIREELGNPETILLGVDRLDYTKGIRHRIKAFGELLDDGRLTVERACLVQVASPSRERVDSYRQLREDIELSVGRLNGTYDTMGHTAIRYLHHAYPIEEMVALYLAADVMLVTALRDGMNLVAKEYVAVRGAGAGHSGVLVLSEFAGAADQLKQAVLVNPHDIDGLKDSIIQAVEMDAKVATRRMRTMSRQIATHDVNRWSREFLDRLGTGTA